ncbi:hypothetical protein QBC47DRAFT_413381 [Echria macrotheca]|uniref:Uncharacterized protein n=1 Tax=Echria macrotheca TaxID=438768 RepID=A0AAJ0BC92_9PEZI|nr:hypothetical protein QBC47DRAFT_413381 [Echria macrotheca]
MAGLGIGEILAVTSLVMQVVESVEKVIQIFEKAQNAPSELAQLRVSLLRMSRHFDMIQAEHKATGCSLIHKDDADEIEDTLRCCKALFDDYDRARSRGAVLQAVWGTQQADTLARYQARIDRHFLQILLPLWVATGTINNSRARSKASPSIGPSSWSSSTQSVLSSSPTTKKVSIVPSKHISDLSQGIEMLKSADNRQQSEKTLQVLDESLRKCWAELGLPVDGLYEISSSEVLRRRSVSYQVAPTILKLENAPPKHKKISLYRVHIMAKDKDSRILLYQNKDVSVQVTQIIQFGCIPWTSEKNSSRVSFLNEHVITVIDKDGHHIYHIDPKYHFDSLESCQRFQETLRERKHLGAFDFVELTRNGVTLSRRHVLRFWRRDVENSSKPVITMTFLASSVGDGCRHKEYDMSDFDSDAVYVSGSFGALRKPKESLLIQLSASLVSSGGAVRIKFETKEAAREFKSFYRTLYQLAPQVDLQLPSSASISSSTTGPTPSDDYWRDGQPPSASDISLGEPGDDSLWDPGLWSRSSTLVKRDEEGH